MTNKIKVTAVFNRSANDMAELLQQHSTDIKVATQPMSFSWEQQLLQLLGVPNEVRSSAAIYGAREENLSAQHILRIDPVHIQLTHNSSYYMGSEVLSLRDKEVQALNVALNDFLSADNMALYTPKHHEWYLALPEPAQIKTCYPGEVLGKDIYNFLPQGAQGISKNFWRRWFTELQMFLHQQPVNEQRRSQGLPEVNALWLWGEGEEFFSATDTGEKKLIATDLSWVRGLATQLGYACESTMYMNKILSPLQTSRKPRSGLSYYDENNSEQNQKLQHEHYLMVQSQLDDEKFDVLMQGIKNNKIANLHVITNYQQWRITPKRWWWPF